MLAKDIEAGQAGELLSAFELFKEGRIGELVARDERGNCDYSRKQHGNAPTGGGKTVSQQQEHAASSHQAEGKSEISQRHPKRTRAAFSAKFRQQRRRPTKFAAYADSLNDAEKDKEYWGRYSYPCITWKQTRQTRAGSYHEDVYQECKLSPGPVPKVAENEGTEQACGVPGCIRQVGKHQGLCRRQLREEDLRKGACHCESENRKIIKLHEDTGGCGKSQNDQCSSIGAWY